MADIAAPRRLWTGTFESRRDTGGRRTRRAAAHAHRGVNDALSYAGQFNLTVVADRDLCPDIEVFVAGVQRSLEALERSVALTAS